MNGSGFFCFFILLAFVSIEFGFLEKAGEAGHSLALARQAGFEAESVSMARSVLEESADAVVLDALKQGIAMDLEGEGIKWLVNERLSALFGGMESVYGQCPVVSFEEKGVSFLNGNSSVFVQRVGKKEVVAEYSFTGGLMRDRPLNARISCGNAEAFFSLPAGYTMAATVVD